MVQFLFSLLPIVGHSFELDYLKFREKLQEPLPTWMVQQIEEDLSPFRGRKICRQTIRRTIENVLAIPSGRHADFVFYRIENNKIEVESFSESLMDVRIAHVVEILEDISKCAELPNVEFLASIWDSYDNPLYLEKTECPVFAICKLKTNHRAVLFPEFRHFSYRKGSFERIQTASHDIPWESKEDIAFWRGMTSGFHYTYDGWDLKPRSRLVLLSKETPHLLNAAFTSPYSLTDPVKTIMEKADLFAPWMYITDFVKYKYLIAIDGNTFASNFWWELLSNCTVLKSESDYVEWFYRGVQPNVHYIPYALDTSDLKEKIIWLKSHDNEARQIADAGALFAKEHLSNESLAVYFYKLLEAYALLQQ